MSRWRVLLRLLPMRQVHAMCRLSITLSSSPKEKGQQQEEQAQATWPDKPAATASVPNCDTGGLSSYQGQEDKKADASLYVVDCHLGLRQGCPKVAR
jgi:hypothetical protein